MLNAGPEKSTRAPAGATISRAVTSIDTTPPAKVRNTNFPPLGKTRRPGRRVTSLPSAGQPAPRPSAASCRSKRLGRCCRWMAGWVLILVCATSAHARTGPVLPLGHSGRWLTDATGRVVVLHGLNMMDKFPPYLPSAQGFDNRDAA